MKGWIPFAGIAALAILAGTSLWLAGGVSEPAPTEAAPPDIDPAATLSASFRDTQGNPRTLATFSGNLVVVNFWATWCAPCREEMPGFSRLQEKWGPRGVRFVGLSDDDAQKIAEFGRRLGIVYPLWAGESGAMVLSRRLGNRLGVLPHTVLLDPRGNLLESRIGLYAEEDLDQRISQILLTSHKIS